MTGAPAGLGQFSPTTPANSKPALSDGLAKLRLLAEKKHIPLAAEFALYLAEFGTELGQLDTALIAEDAAQAGHSAHLLYGRCGFIGELELEQTLRKIEIAGATGEWNEARRSSREVHTLFDGLRVKLAAAAGSAAPPA